MKKGKIIILSAPSGTGKSTIISRLMEMENLNLGFSISATCRKPREGEMHGREYYFLTPEEFKAKVENNEFVEWEEVYAGTCYGTLVSEVERITSSGRNLIMDVDVKGGVNIKKFFGNEALSIFILPPSRDVLEARLRGRGNNTAEDIERRLAKADFEMSFAPGFDLRIINDKLDEAVGNVAAEIVKFIGQ